MKRLLDWYKTWQFRRKSKAGYQLTIARYQSSILHKEFLALLSFIRNPDDCMRVDLPAIKGFKFNDDITQWLEARQCQYKVELILQPRMAEKKNDTLVFYFLQEHDRLEFKLTFL